MKRRFSPGDFDRDQPDYYGELRTYKKTKNMQRVRDKELREAEQYQDYDNYDDEEDYSR